MNYQKFTKLVRMYGMLHNVDTVITSDDAKFAYIAYTNFNVTVNDAIKLTLELKTK